MSGVRIDTHPAFISAVLALGILLGGCDSAKQNTNRPDYAYDVQTFED